MKPKNRIAVFGIGGVGGYIGGKLAHRYHDDPDVEISFIARGENGEKIREKGLTLKTTKGTLQAVPDRVYISPEPYEGIADYVVYCLKSYSVKDSIPQLAAMTDRNSVIIPFMNGLDGTERLRQEFPDRQIWDACVFIMAHLESPGTVIENGHTASYYFGSAQGDRHRMATFENLCGKAGVKALYRENILQRVWDKFSYISPLATLSTAYNLTNGDILSDRVMRDKLITLFMEFGKVAKASGIHLPSDIAEINIGKMMKTPLNMTTSMQRDFYAGKQSEYESLTGYVVRKAEETGVPVPEYELLYHKIQEKALRQH